MYYVYVLVSKDVEHKYIGYTKDLERRLAEHKRGEVKSTKNRGYELCYYEAYREERDARKREKKLKCDGRSRRQLYLRIDRSLRV